MCICFVKGPPPGRPLLFLGELPLYAMPRAMAEGIRAGGTGTPRFFIEGRLRSGAQPLESIVSTIEGELARAG
jgi:hypothetical protein